MRGIDVHHIGTERVICCWQVGEVLVDPGPESSLQTLLEALGDEVPRALLLTHIHLDHAGGTGALVRRWPHLEVWVHEVGAPHLVDPSKLLTSAARLYGDDMERLWGEVLPVPEENVRTLAGGESIHGFRVAYTPGHASHHVSYLHAASGRAFVGDVAGVRIPPSDLVMAPTPPPDIDLEAWSESLDAVAAWEPASLGLTHFGAVEEPGPQLEAVRAWLRDWAPRARELDEEGFVAAVSETIAAHADRETAVALAQAAPPDQLYKGLERYWRKREALRPR
jgi:glyoxylase-like metal-dependent hydrolase (beta-lactamase superfamily II)